MARVLALIPDLLFGSRVQGMLLGAGHEVELAGDCARVRALLRGGEGFEVLILDLTVTEPDGVGLLRELIAGGELGETRTLAFYAHVDPAARERALDAGCDLVVPRSRMAREGAALVERLAGG
ncbi:MAG TPA: hypothetical protein VGX16_04190 [Solirubrobacteraceae bacterium]|jgi:CheY-like chemotaxis protein|nr:hypothetical protein [Solirubrobacteraceae bacterium]